MVVGMVNGRLNHLRDTSQQVYRCLTTENFEEIYVHTYVENVEETYIHMSVVKRKVALETYLRGEGRGGGA